MKIEVENCNNIVKAEISLEKGLNVKYAPNGTGKTTLAKAICASIIGDTDALLKLQSFREGSVMPSVKGTESMHSVKVFNEEYVDKFVFTQDKLFPNTFEVFVKTKFYEERMKAIGNHLAKIHGAFAENGEIEELIQLLKRFTDGFGRATTGYAKSSPIAKGIAKGNVVENIPESLKRFSQYIKSEMRLAWLKWHRSGVDFRAIDESQCPYCTNSIVPLRETIKELDERYDSKSVEHLVNMVNVFKEMVKDGLSEEMAGRMTALIKNIDGMGEDDREILDSLRRQAEGLKDKLCKLKGVNFYNLKTVEKVAERLKELRIKSEDYLDLMSGRVTELVMRVNAVIDGVLGSAEELQTDVREQQRLLASTINENKTLINGFLELACYPYAVDIDDVGDGEFRTRLNYVGEETIEVANAKEHLSYGERNAFALVLFVCDVASANPDLVILDDPISSFDGNKKFALLNLMFWRDESKTLSGRMVLMLTHDFCPVIDVVKTFDAHFPCAHKAWYLHCNNGILCEGLIKQDDILSVTQLNEKNMSDEKKDNLLRIVYFRKWKELRGERKSASYELASNLEHLRTVPQKMSRGRVLTDMTSEEIQRGLVEIQGRIETFDYNVEVKRASSYEILRKLYSEVSNNYEKVLVFKYMHELLSSIQIDDILKKQMHEPFHIGNDYIFQLNPVEFEVIQDAQIRLFDAVVKRFDESVGCKL